MVTRYVIGRKIVRVKQTRCYDQQHDLFYHIDWLELDNGTTITFNVVELDGDYGIESTATRGDN